MTFDVVFSPEARDDLLRLYVYIADSSSADRALGYLERIETYCRGFSQFPVRGARRDDLFPGLRIIGFERRVTIAFHVDGSRIVIDRILYGGRDLSALRDDA